VPITNAQIARRRAGFRKCVLDPCGRHARPGSLVCWHHRRHHDARAVAVAVRRATEDAERSLAGDYGDHRDDDEPGCNHDPDAAAERFRRLLATGRYGDLFDAPLASVLDQAAQARHLDHETGALRYALARTLAEETDPARLVLAVTRLTRAVIATSRERREIARDTAARDDRRDRAAHRTSWLDLMLPDSAPDPVCDPVGEPELHEPSA